MQDSEIKKGGGKRTDADRDTAFRLGTGTGPGRVSDSPVKSQNEQGKGNAAKRRMKKEELESTGLFSEDELAGLEEKMSAFELVKQSMGNSYIDPNAPKKEKSKEEKDKEATKRAENRAAFAKKEHDRLYGKKND